MGGMLARKRECVRYAFCVPGGGFCCFVKNKILENESIEIEGKWYSEKNGVETIAESVAKKWDYDETIQISAIYFVWSKNSNSKEKLLAEFFTFLFETIYQKKLKLL